MKTIDTNNYSEPAPELIDDIRKRLADVPQETLERARHALMHEPIQHAASILYKAGVCLGSHELYEYRKTLFRSKFVPAQLGEGFTTETRGR